MISTAIELTQTIQDIVAIAGTIEGVEQAGKDVNAVINGVKAPENTRDVTATCEKAAAMRVKLNTWAVIRQKADEQLSSSPIDEVGGSQDYHKALGLYMLFSYFI